MFMNDAWTNVIRDFNLEVAIEETSYDIWVSKHNDARHYSTAAIVLRIDSTGTWEFTKNGRKSSGRGARELREALSK